MILWLVAALAAPLEGRIMERGTGNPVAGVEVRSGKAAYITGLNGRFVLDLDEEQTHTLSVTSLAHEPLTVDVAPPFPSTLRLYVTPGLGELEIVVESFQPTPHLTRHTVDSEQAMETPGNYEDAVRLVQSLPGVAVQRDLAPNAGDLLIRGSQAGDSRYYLDGVEVPYLYHFNQYASVFPVSQIGQLTLYPSTFSSAYGDAVGGIVDTQSRLDKPRTVHGDVMANFVIGGASVTAPVSKDWWVSASGRRSYQDLVGEQTDQFTLWPVFGDFALRAEKGDLQNGIGIFLWGANDRYDRAAGELDVLDPFEATAAPSFRYRRGFQVGGIRHQWQGAETDGRVVLALVHDRLSGELTTGGEEQMRTLWLTTRGDLVGRLGDQVGWSAGWEGRQEWMDLSVDPAQPGIGLLVASEAPALGRGNSVEAKQARTRTGLYGDLRFLALDDSLRIMPGVRLEGDSAGGAGRVDPRFAMRWKAADQTEIKVAAGLYSQRPDTEHLVDTPDLPTTRSAQVGAGLEQTVANRLEILVDGYGKFISKPLFYPVDAPAVVADRGTAWGVELVTRYRLREVFFLWGWVGVGRSFTWVDGEQLRADADRPFSVGSVLSWELGRDWRLGLRYRGASGALYTAVQESLYDADDDTWIPVKGQENGVRLPFYHKVDLRIAKTFTFNRWTLTTSAELWMVPPSSAQLYPTWSYDWREETFVRGPVILPLLTARARF